MLWQLKSKSYCKSFFYKQSDENKKPSVDNFFLCVFSTFNFAQTEEKFDFYTRGEYNSTVPRPASILRFDVGDQHTTYAQMEMFINAVAKSAPERVKIFDIGLTNENRMQHIVAISSPQNMARLSEIKSQNARLFDPRTTNQSEANSIIQNNPAIAWMAYTIHGDESASFEAMMQVVYQLAASNEPQTLEVLDNCVTLIITGENPDGHERFVTWYNSVATGNEENDAIEHSQPWSIRGRFNHYRFDLNRDNVAMSQKETQNMVRAFMDWNPQVAVDHHGQPSQFFFPPAALPINPNLPQPMTNKWLDTFGRANANAFDRNKWDYYVRDIFDLFYPGYWDSYPSLNGAIGMTYETDGGGFKGLRWKRDDGTIVTLRSAIAKHFVASLTTLETLAANRQSRLKDFYDFRREAIAEVSREPMKRIVILPNKDVNKTAEMIEILQNSKIEVKVANSSFSTNSAHSYMQKDAPRSSQNFPVGAYIIDLNQPQKKLIKALLEQDTPQDDAFVKDNMERFRRNERRSNSSNKEGYGFYDITAWNLPLAFGVDAFWTEDAANVDSIVVSADYLENVKRGNVGGRAQIAYIVPYESDASAAMAMRLLMENFRVSVTSRTLTAGGRNYKPGAFVVRVTRNSDAIHEAINRLSRELGVNVSAVNTGYTEEGDTNVGSENVLPMQKPRIAVVADDAVSHTSYGSLWWMLDRYKIRFTPLSLSSIRGGALKNYNVLIMPDGSSGRYSAMLGASGISGLKEWVSGGGTLITFGGASVFAADKNVDLTSARIVGSADDEQAADGRKEVEEDTDEPTEDKNSASSPQTTRRNEIDKADPKILLPPIISPSADFGQTPESIPGAIMRAMVDRTTYLNYGVESNEIPVLMSGGSFFRYSKEGTNALIFAEKPRQPLTISGFVWEGNTERLLKGTSYLIDEPNGSGHVILFADDPFFRAIFRSTTRQFFNGILFNGVF